MFLRNEKKPRPKANHCLGTGASRGSTLIVMCETWPLH